MTEKTNDNNLTWAALTPDEWKVVMATLDEIPGKFTRQIANKIESQTALSAEPAPAGRQPKAAKA